MQTLSLNLRYNSEQTKAATSSSTKDKSQDASSSSFVITNNYSLQGLQSGLFLNAAEAATITVTMPYQRSRTAQLIRFSTLHVALAFLISKLFETVGIIQFPFEASSVSFWTVIIIILMIYSNAIIEIVPYFELPSIAHLYRLIPRHQGFDYLIKQLSDIVEKHYPNALLFDESPVRMWGLIAFKCLYKFTGDVISGSLASAILISFLAHPDLLPYVFITWAIFAVMCLVVSYFNNNGTAQHAEL